MIDIAPVIQSARHYFDELGGGGFSCNAPFVLSREEGVGRYILEFTAAITVSGEFDGAVYVTVPRAMVDALVKQILGESGSEEELVDMAGELVNTVTGNLRQGFGDGFVISVPMVIRGQNVHIDLPKLVSPIYIVPCRWREYEFFLCAGLDKLARR